MGGRGAGIGVGDSATSGSCMGGASNMLLSPSASLLSGLAALLSSPPPSSTGVATLLTQLMLALVLLVLSPCVGTAGHAACIAWEVVADAGHVHEVGERMHAGQMAATCSLPVAGMTTSCPHW